AEGAPTPTPTTTPKPTPTPTPAPATNINNVVNVTVDNSSNNSSNNSSSNNNEVKVEQKVEQKNIAKKTEIKKAKVAAAVQVAPQYVYVTPQVVHVPVTAKTGPTALATLLITTLTGGSGLAYVVRKAIAG
ncbi:MAG: hypothetical protein AAB649_01545, partial [Patescibacteria group bacterium]